MKFIVCVPRFDPTSGGTIVLYKLARVLRSLGHDALIWPIHRIPRRDEGMTARALRRVGYMATRIYRPRFKPHPELTGLIATECDLNDAVVVYPETVPGNPLGADKFVRWVLYRPGELGVESRYYPGDLYFCFQEAFNVNCEGMDYGGTLFVLDWMKDVYRQTNFGPRDGVCFMVRKGRERQDLPPLDGLEVLDGLGHPQLAQIFNVRRACYFFDPYTAYSEYAALCGCIPIVVPIPGVGKESWTPTAGGRPGVAYGDDDVAQALASRPRLLQYIEDSERAGIESVRRFVSVVSERLGGAEAVC